MLRAQGIPSPSPSKFSRGRAPSHPSGTPGGVDGGTLTRYVGVKGLVISKTRMEVMADCRLLHRHAPTQFGAHSYRLSSQRFTMHCQADVLHRRNVRVQTCTLKTKYRPNFRRELLDRDVGRVREIDRRVENRTVRARLTRGYRLSELAPEPMALEEAVERRTINAGKAGSARHVA
jgi:hypothetical protein